MGQGSAWLQTFTGKQFYPLEPRIEDIDIMDIAHSLSLQCRFAGHINEFYSVAQHSVLVSIECPPKDALWGLLHDASEAYLVDVPRPLKHHPSFKAYREAEDKLMAAICDKFGMEAVMPFYVRHADNVLLATEKRDLMGQEPAPWSPLPEPCQERIKAVMPDEAKRLFLERFYKLNTGKVGDAP